MAFPRPKTSFVGRGEDLTRLAELCAAGASIVTLWGPPGIGKTRLAVELGRRGNLQRGDGRAQAWFCDIASARDIADVCAALVDGLGVSAPSAPPTVGWLATALSSRPPGLL